MKENNIHKGIWWLPHEPEKQVCGTLTTQTDDIVLEIIGELGNISVQRAFDENSIIRHSVIWGVDSEATPISVFGCVANSSRNTSCPFSLVRYKAQVVAIGAHIKSWDDLGNYDIKASIPELPLWFRPNCLKVQTQGKDILWKTNFQDSNEVSVPIEDGCQLIIEGEVHCSENVGGLSISIEQDAILRLTFNHAISMQDAKQKVFQFEQFLSFATLSPVQCAHFWLIDKDKQKDPLQKCSIEIIEKRVSRTINVRFWEYLFIHETIAESFGKVIKKWYENKDLYPIRAHLIDSISHKGYFGPNDFLIICQAIEGFYCRFRKDKESLTNIFNKLITEFSDIQCQEVSETDIPVIVDIRNYLSHLLPPNRRKYVLDEHEQYNLNHKLRKLLICCVLKLIGFSNDEINNIFAHSRNPYLRMINGQPRQIVEDKPIKLDAKIVSLTQISEVEPE